MLERELDSRMSSLERDLEGRGIDLEDYLIASRQPRDDLRESVRPDAERYVRRTIVLDAIAKRENLEVSEEEVSEHVEQMARGFGIPPAALREHLADGDALSGVERAVLRRKTVELLVENAELEEVRLPAEEEAPEDGATEAEEGQEPETEEEAPAETDPPDDSPTSEPEATPSEDSGPETESDA